MKQIREIDAFAFTRPTLSAQERKNLHWQTCQQQKEDGYQQLVELCRLGEHEAAKQLANQHSIWGYEIVDKVVIEKND